MRPSILRENYNFQSIISWKNPHPENIYDCQSENGNTRFKQVGWPSAITMTGGLDLLKTSRLESKLPNTFNNQGCFDHLLDCINGYSNKASYILAFVVLLQVRRGLSVSLLTILLSSRWLESSSVSPSAGSWTGGNSRMIFPDRGSNRDGHRG